MAYEFKDYLGGHMSFDSYPKFGVLSSVNVLTTGTNIAGPYATEIMAEMGAKVIQVYTIGSYFSAKRNRFVIGTPMDPAQYMNGAQTEKEAIEQFSEAMRSKILELEKLTHG